MKTKTERQAVILDVSTGIVGLYEAFGYDPADGTAERMELLFQARDDETLRLFADLNGIAIVD